MHRPLGIPAQAELRSCPETRNTSSEAARKAGCAEQGSPCPRQELPPPTASPAQHLCHVVAHVSFCSWLRHVQILAGFFFLLFFVILKTQTINYLLIYSHLPFFPALSFSLMVLASFCHFLSHLNSLWQWYYNNWDFFVSSYYGTVNKSEFSNNEIYWTNT